MDSFLMALAGVFCLCAAALDWDFFFENFRARPFVRLFGRNGARVVYGLIGMLLVVASFGTLFRH